MDKARSTYILNCEISSIETVSLGGYPQKIAMEGKARHLPLVICLHGGPGLPMPFSVGCRGLFPDITDRFIMVYWDQLGCGVNNHTIDNSFTAAHFVNMTVDLIKEMRAHFPQNRLYLFGLSWGSILALRTALQAPELLDGVVTCGQVVTAPLLSDSAFDAVECSAAPARLKRFARTLRAKRPDISFTEVTTLSRVIRKYTDGYNHHAAKPAPLGGIIKGLLSSQDYSLKDFIAVFKNGYAKNTSLMQEMASSELRGAFNDIVVPYHIFQGESDIVTATEDVVAAVERANNQNVTYSVLPNIGHFPSEAAIAEIFEMLSQL